ncbi:MAG: class I SAM-dependent methyltransferase [Lachnospiraceae bacterium]|nr:class I SAM-dependent methyltransferase [Lachnospiraceae bacterium]
MAYRKSGYSRKFFEEHRKEITLHKAAKDGDASFDAVIISNALHIIPDPEKALSEINRVPKKDGILIAPNFIN